jgi:hypothetical protein
MSLLTEMDAINAQKIGLKPSNKKNEGEEDSIMRADEFLKIVRTACESVLLDKKTAKAWSQHRTRLTDCKWKLTGLLGNVGPSTFNGKVDASLKYMLKHIEHTQGNGEWKPMEFEADIRRDGANNECIMVVVRWVDANNADDLQYHNGAPAVNVNVKTSPLPDEVLNALSSRSTGDDELKELLKQLIGTMASNTAAAPIEDATAKEGIEAV